MLFSYNIEPSHNQELHDQRIPSVKVADRQGQEKATPEETNNIGLLG
jgi:hypothetical protein